MKTFEVEIEVQDETTLEEIEEIIGKALDDNGVECMFSVEEE